MRRAALWGKQGDKKGKCLGKIDFLTSVCTRTRNQQSAIWISKIWPKVVKLSADCATKGTKRRRYTDEARPGGKQGDKERRRKHSRDYKCSSRCNAQFIFILLIGFWCRENGFWKKKRHKTIFVGKAWNQVDEQAIGWWQ